MSLKLNAQLAQQLIATQFPQFENYQIKPVELSGNDNRTFRLGEEMLIRLPSAKGYAAQVEKEQLWLPKLGQHLSIEIPTPLHQGKPCEIYPWSWSIYNWIEGESANQVDLTSIEMEILALDLANFLKNLQQAPIKGAPMGGAHNYYRGCSTAIYDIEARADLKALSNVIDVTKALRVWEQALISTWNLQPVWVHGDVAPGNFLIRNSKLAAVIDFGCMAIGDPACDLVIAWTFFQGAARECFKNTMVMDTATWERAKGWALWKASFELVRGHDKSESNKQKNIKIINELLKEI